MAESNTISAFYDTVAENYALRFCGEHEKKPMDLEMLARFAAMTAGAGPVLDLGCGPGHTANHLHGLGVEISGIDISPGLIAQARTLFEHLDFALGDMLALDVASGTLAGAVAFYSIVHFTREQVHRAFVEIQRILRPGAPFLCTFHVGDEPLHVTEFLGHKVDAEVMLFPVKFIEDALRASGFTSIDTTGREPYPDVEYPSRRAYVFAAKHA